MNKDKHDKAISLKDLPKPQQDTDTKQPEEFIDESSVRKNEADLSSTDTKQQEAEKPDPRNQ